MKSKKGKISLGLVGVILVAGWIGTKGLPIDMGRDKTVRESKIEMIDIKEEGKYDESDKEYLESKLNTKVIHSEGEEKELDKELKNEIVEIEHLLEKYRKNYSVIKGAKVYSPKTTLRIHYLTTSLKNRLSVLEKINKGDLEMVYVYENSIFYNGEDVELEYKILEKIDEKDSSRIYREVIETLESTKYPKGLIEGTKIFISPFMIRGSEGYAYSNGLEGKDEIVVVSKGTSSTEEILNHELGHILKYSLMGVRSKGNKAWEEYVELYGGVESENWEENIEEGFAEDFRIKISGESGEDKRTNYEYKGKEFKEFLNRNMREIDTRQAVPSVYMELEDVTSRIKVLKGENFTYTTGGDKVKIKIGKEDVVNDKITVVVKLKEEGVAKRYRVKKGDIEIKTDKEGHYLIQVCRREGRKLIPFSEVEIIREGINK